VSVTATIRSAELAKDSNRVQVLWSQAGIAAAGSDVYEMEGSPGHGGQHQRRPKDLATPFTETAIDLEHFRLASEYTPFPK
jgi:hypothetical protein